MPKHASIEDVLSFWFEEITPEHWFKKDDSFDETIRARFEPMVTAALAAQLDDWADTAEGCLALIILWTSSPAIFTAIHPAPLVAMRWLWRSVCDVLIVTLSGMKTVIGGILC